MTIFAVANDTQRALFNYEIVGQLSDGEWENARPRNHWKEWCNCDVVTVGTTHDGLTIDGIGRNFYAKKDNYALTRKDLLESIGTRMLALARLVDALGYEDGMALADLIDWYKPDTPTIRLRFDGDRYTGAYWDRMREKAANAIAKHGEHKLLAIVEASTYTMKDLKGDLNGIKAAMKNHRDFEPADEQEIEDTTPTVDTSDIDGFSFV